MPNGGEASGGQVPQIVVLRRGPERAYPLVGERGPQKQGREMGCMGAVGPSSFGITHLGSGGKLAAVAWGRSRRCRGAGGTGARRPRRRPAGNRGGRGTTARAWDGGGGPAPTVRG